MLIFLLLYFESRRQMQWWTVMLVFTKIYENQLCCLFVLFTSFFLWSWEAFVLMQEVSFTVINQY